MNDRIKWKAEVAFEGTLAEFTAFKEALEKQPVAISVAEWVRPGHFAGYIPVDFRVRLDSAKLKQMVEGMPRLQYAGIKEIAGGIRTPHLHLGDDVVLVDRERFKTIVGEVARDLFEQRALVDEDYYDVIKPIAAMPEHV